MGIGKGACIVRGKRPFMRRLRESGLFTVVNRGQFIEGLINKRKGRTLKSRRLLIQK